MPRVATWKRPSGVTQPRNLPSVLQGAVTRPRGVDRDQTRADAEGGLFLLTVHPHVSDYRSRIFILEELIGHIRGHDGVWFASHAEITGFAAQGLRDAT